MAVAVVSQQTRLGRGFDPINASERRQAPRKQFQSITGAEITTAINVDIMMHKTREENITKYPHNQVMGADIGHDYEYVGIHDNDPVFAMKEPTRSQRRTRADATWGDGFSSMAAFHFGKVKHQEHLNERIRFVGFATGTVEWRGGRLPAPAQVGVRIAGAGTAEFTGNDVVEPGQIVTYEPFSVDENIRKLQFDALPPTQLRPKQKLVPILRTMRSEELVDWIGDAAAESFFTGNREIIHNDKGFAVLLEPDYMDNLMNSQQVMLDVRCLAAVQGFVHILTAAQAGIVTINGNIDSPNAATKKAAIDAANGVFSNPQRIAPELVMALAQLHGLTGQSCPTKDYLDLAFARGFRGILPLEANEVIKRASDISDSLAPARKLSQFNEERDWTNRSNVVMGLVQQASHSLYNTTTSAYWEKRSRAICMATTAAGPGERFNYLLLIS
jgi:hypothetical protein